MASYAALAAAPRPLLVTGMSGFLGEHLGRFLAQAGLRVAGTFLQRPIQVPRADAVPVDLRDKLAVGRLVRDMRPPVIFHTAAMTDPNQCETDPQGAHHAIVGATANLIAAVQEHSPDTHLIALSTDLVFSGDNAPYSEVDGAKPLMVYGGQKRQMEVAVNAMATGTVVRAALIYGPPATHKGSFLAWMRGTLEKGEPLTLFSDEVRTPVFSGDLCEALASIAERRLFGLYHAGGPERLTRLEMGRLTCEVFGHPESLLAPRLLAEVPTAAPRPRDVSLDSSRLRDAIGYSPRTFREGLRAVAASIAE
ncbi:MAG: SDR family oxidoreductase [Sumerlaeia bacterium]